MPGGLSLLSAVPLFGGRHQRLLVLGSGEEPEDNAALSAKKGRREIAK